MSDVVKKIRMAVNSMRDSSESHRESAAKYQEAGKTVSAARLSGTAEAYETAVFIIEEILKEVEDERGNQNKMA